MSLISRLVLLGGAAVMLLLVACGDSDDDDATTAPDDGTAQSTAGATSSTGDSDDGDSDDGDSGDGDSDGDGDEGGTLNTARITVGDETFDFEWETGLATCNPEFFGGFVAATANSSDQANFELELFPESVGRAPKVEVGEANNGTRWTADPEERAGQRYDDWPAQVDSFEIDGNSATGTATFVGEVALGGEPEGVAGTFEVTCASS